MEVDVLNVTADHKKIARTIAAAFGHPKPSVSLYRDENEASSVAVAVAEDRPHQGDLSCATIHLSDHDIGKVLEGKRLRVELVGAAHQAFDIFPNVLSTCAFYHINDRLPLFPGAIYRDVIAIYERDYTMRHCLLTTPFLWDLPKLTFADRIVTWLQVVPISETERLYAAKLGVEALEDLLQERKADVCDLNRRSVI